MTSGDGDLDGRRLVLVVDDDGASRLIARASLEQAGFDVVEAANGLEGVAAFERQPPALVLLDVLMPGMDGFAACALIRALPVGKHTPILMLTGLDDVESIRQAYQAGATDFATKPLNGIIVGYRVRHLIRAGRAFEEIFQAERKNRALLQAIPDLILRVSREGQILGAHMERKRVRHSRYEAYLGRNLSEFMPPDAAERAMGMLERALASGELHGAEFQLPEGQRVRQLEARMAGGGSSEVIVFVRDVTRRKRREERLAYLAFNDPLTGLPNRTRLVERLQEELARWRRHKQRFAVAILRIDLFREIIDEYGQALGDRLLRTLADLLRVGMRETDMVARIAHNEFGLLITGLDGEFAASKAVQRVLQLLSRGISVDQKDYYLTACMGVSLVGPDGEATVVSLLKQADIALGRARRLGRNQVQLFSKEMSDSISRRIELEAELGTAIDQDQFVVHYQPEVDVRTGRIVGAEALVRWMHPTKGLVPPMQFIPLAEETGIIVAITEHVTGAACRQARAWQEEGFPPLVVAVNVSGRFFREPRLAGAISDILRESGLAPGHLEIEITESVAMSDSERTIEVLQALHGEGIRVAIDDFGTGYSSLAYLRRFPIQQLKIDQAFIKDMMDNREDRAIVDAVIGMAHAMGMEVLAEGVERTEQLEYLRSKGCDKAQGYLFGRPVPAEEFRELLRRQQQDEGVPA
jgi:diguanylate cyclase (GGDEF)-like protein/PAS domain S-box-containing protein